MLTSSNYKQTGPKNQSLVEPTAYTNGHGPAADGLNPNHLAMLIDGSGISPQVIAARGYRSINNIDDLHRHGFANLHRKNVPGFLIPVHTPDRSQPFAVYRPDNPRVIEEKDKGKLPDGTYPCKTNKYEMPKGESMRLDCPPVCAENMGDPSVTLWITEGPKKADALASRGLCAVALLGVWNWRGRNSVGGKALLADFHDIAIEGRDIRIVFDSDVTTNAHVDKARSEIVEVLKRKKAHVSVVTLLPDPSGGKVGIDDYFVQGGTVASLEALASSQRAVTPARASGKRQKPLSGDIIKALEAIGYGFRMRVLDDRIEVNGVPISDTIGAIIRAKMRDAGFESMAAVEDVYKMAAALNAYHPIKDYLNSLKWDGVDHIARLSSYFPDTHDPIRYPDGTEKSVFHAWLQRWLVGAVGKAIRGNQNMMLVLDGPQDIGKSSFVAWLGSPLPQYFIEGSVNPDDKDTFLRLISKWIWEVGELGATTRKADVEALKAFITQQEVTVRSPYGRFDLTKPAVASLIGTINNTDGFLNDPSGSRRFYVVTLRKIDWAYSNEIDVNQLWAQAVALFNAGHTGRLDPTEKMVQDAMNKGYDLINPVEDYIAQHFEITGDRAVFLTVPNMLERMKFLGYRGTDLEIAKHFKRAMAKLGIEQGRGPRLNGREKPAPRGYYGIKPRMLSESPSASGTQNQTSGTHAVPEDDIIF